MEGGAIYSFFNGLLGADRMQPDAGAPLLGALAPTGDGSLNRFVAFGIVGALARVDLPGQALGSSFWISWLNCSNICHLLLCVSALLRDDLRIGKLAGLRL